MYDLLLMLVYYWSISACGKETPWPLPPNGPFRLLLLLLLCHIMSTSRDQRLHLRLEVRTHQAGIALPGANEQGFDNRATSGSPPRSAHMLRSWQMNGQLVIHEKWSSTVLKTIGSHCFHIIPGNRQTPNGSRAGIKRQHHVESLSLTSTSFAPSPLSPAILVR